MIVKARSKPFTWDMDTLAATTIAWATVSAEWVVSINKIMQLVEFNRCPSFKCNRKERGGEKVG